MLTVNGLERRENILRKERQKFYQTILDLYVVDKEKTPLKWKVQLFQKSIQPSWEYRRTPWRKQILEVYPISVEKIPIYIPTYLSTYLDQDWCSKSGAFRIWGKTINVWGANCWNIGLHQAGRVTGFRIINKKLNLENYQGQSCN